MYTVRKLLPRPVETSSIWPYRALDDARYSLGMDAVLSGDIVIQISPLIDVCQNVKITD